MEENPDTNMTVLMSSPKPTSSPSMQIAFFMITGQAKVAPKAVRNCWKYKDCDLDIDHRRFLKDYSKNFDNGSAKEVVRKHQMFMLLGCVFYIQVTGAGNFRGQP